MPTTVRNSSTAFSMAKTSAKDIAYQELLTNAVRLRLAKTPYDEIISTLGHWNSISACQKAVAGYLRRNQTSAVDESRAEAIALLEDLIFELKTKFKVNKSTLIAREIRNLQREISLHQGNYMPTKIETNTEKPTKILVEYSDVNNTTV